MLPPLPGSTSGSSRSLGRALHGPVCSSSRIHPMSEEDADPVSFLDEKQKSRAWLPLVWVKTKILSWPLNSILPHISWAPPVFSYFPVRLNDLGSEGTLMGPRGCGAGWSSRARVQWEANRAEASVHFGNIWLLRMFHGKLVSPHLWVFS